MIFMILSGGLCSCSSPPQAWWAWSMASFLRSGRWLSSVSDSRVSWHLPDIVTIYPPQVAWWCPVLTTSVSSTGQRYSQQSSGARWDPWQYANLTWSFAHLTPYFCPSKLHQVCYKVTLSWLSGSRADWDSRWYRHLHLTSGRVSGEWNFNTQAAWKLSTFFQRYSIIMLTVVTSKMITKAK